MQMKGKNKKDEFHISCEISELKYHQKTHLMLYCII